MVLKKRQNHKTNMFYIKKLLMYRFALDLTFEPLDLNTSTNIKRIYFNG